MVSRPTAEAQQAIDDAVLSPDASDRAADLTAAAESQGELADTLAQLADHYAALEAGEDVTASRAALRQAEEELGIRDALEQRFAPLAELANLAVLPPEELLAQLEEELRRNEGMQRELGVISEDALAQARAQLEGASEEERDIAERLERAEREQERSAQSLGQRLERVGKKARQLGAGEVRSADREAQKAEATESDGRGDNAETIGPFAYAVDPIWDNDSQT